MYYDNITLDKSLYTSDKGFTPALERLDPSEQYHGTKLEGLDAYERQLKRFGIHVSGAQSHSIHKFFESSESTTLFPEFIARAVRKGLEQADVLPRIVAATTRISSTDYRSLSCATEPDADRATLETERLPETLLRTKPELVRMKKHGRVLSASFESLRYHRIDLFTVALRQIGAEIARTLLADAVDVLINGDGTPDTSAPVLSRAGGSLSYEDLVTLWNQFDPCVMNALIGDAGTLQEILALPELRDGAAGLNFHGNGKRLTPLGAELIKSAAVPEGMLVALDKTCALELVQSGEVITDYDKLIDRQLNCASISVTAGFAVISSRATAVLL